MKTRTQLESSDVQTLLQAATAEAGAHGWKVSIAIVDDGGHLLGFTRLDGAAPISAAISVSKARTAALGRRETLAYEEMINNGRTSFLSVPLVDGLLEGGVPVIHDGTVIGAIGVSGVKSAEDAQIAKAGIAALLR